MQIESIQNVLIKERLENPSEWETIVNLNFQPDEVCLKAVLYQNNNNTAKACYVWTDLVNEGYLCGFYDACAYSPNQTFKITKPFTGNNTIRFQARDIVDDGVSTLVGDIVLSLQFIKYARK